MRYDALKGDDMENNTRQEALEILKTIKIPEEHILGHYDEKLGHYDLPKEEDDEDDYDI